ncbi:tRNA-intron lyase [Natronomonas sp. EA1]|uniref:tRNA-intron lyase n=1 Tax=Natronomonas sp. EA1 TaxID=3421655 RepID=UPI003EB6C42A
MKGEFRGNLVHVGPNARERFYDSRGYGIPDGAGLTLAPVEAAHLLYRGDLDSIDGDGLRAFLRSVQGLTARFIVYKDLRDRGFYLVPDREGWVETPGDEDFVVFPRGKGPWDDEVAYRVRVVGERADISARSLGDVVLGVVDEESEITYFETEIPEIGGSSRIDLPSGIEADLLDDQVLVWGEADELYDRGFYGRPLDEETTALQLSLIEASYLAEQGVLDIIEGDAAVLERGQAVEGERFDRRLTVYRHLREQGVVPKTGFKFGADFRTYADVESVDELGHSELLVRVLPAAHAFSPRELALDVRLAHGVRKRMAFALTDGESVEWRAASRLTP